MRKLVVISEDVHDRLKAVVEKIKRYRSASLKRVAEDALEREIARLEKEVEGRR